MSAAGSEDRKPEISPATYSKIDRYADCLSQTPTIDKRKTFEVFAVDLYTDALRETDLAAVQSIADDIYVLGVDYAGLAPDDVEYVMVGAKVHAQMNGNASADEQRADEPPSALSPEEFGSPAERVETRSTGTAVVAFPLCAFENIRLDTARRGYLVKGLLSSTGLAVIWGPPKCGKSFWATDVGLHIALGWEYRGRKVQQATVVYIALEGRHGIPARIEAFRQHHDIKAAPFYLLTTPLDLVAKADNLIASIEAQLGTVRPGVVFVDTLNRSLVGSESKDEDMARYLAAAGKIEQRFGCLVVIVHHCGIDATRPRGHTSLSGAVEVQIAVRRGSPGEIVATTELAKDFAEGDEICSRLERVEVGTDPDGDAIHSMVVTPTETPASSARANTRKLSGRQRLAVEALDECIITSGTSAPAALGLPAGTIVAPIASWRDELLKRAVVDSDGPNPRQDFKRLHTALQSRHVVGINNNLVWRC
jgi:AAA domain